MLTSKIKQKCRELGFDLVKIVAPGDIQVDAAHLKSWLDKGFAGDMEYMHRTAFKKQSALNVAPWATSVIVLGMNYFQADTSLPKGAGRIARYAFGKDYHKIFERRLKALGRFLEGEFVDARVKVYVDTGPLLEKALARKSGMGFIGKNTLLITKEFGSWVLLGFLITDISLEFDRPTMEKWQTCGSCTRCLDVCPTGALKSAYQLDSRLCISYLTIEHRGDIPLELRSKIGNWLFGCDLCQEVCPHNVRAKYTGVDEFLTWRAGSWQDIEGLLRIRSDDEFTRRFAGTPLMRPKRQGLLRNAAIVAGNLKDERLLPVLLEVLYEENDQVILRHARWALYRICNIGIACDCRLPV